MSNYYIALGMEKEADVKKIHKAYRLWYNKYYSDIHHDPEQKKSSSHIHKIPQTLIDNHRRKHDASFYQNTLQNQKLYRDRHIKTFSSPIDEFFEGFVPGFFEYGFTQHKELCLELILSSHEAQKGGDFSIDVPVIYVCPCCHGTGIGQSFICVDCSGFGQIRGSRSFVLHVPARVKHGAWAKVSLEGIGLKAVFLNVEIIIQ